jgi:hypothetical protein
LMLVRDLIQEAERVPWLQTARGRRLALFTSQVQRLDSGTTGIGLCSVREFHAMCVPPKAKKWECISSIKNATCVLPMFWGISHQNEFLRTIWHKNGKVKYSLVSEYYHCNCWTYIFQ